MRKREHAAQGFALILLRLIIFDGVFVPETGGIQDVGRARRLEVFAPEALAESEGVIEVVNAGIDLSLIEESALIDVAGAYRIPLVIDDHHLGVGIDFDDRPSSRWRGDPENRGRRVRQRWPVVLPR